MIRRNTWQRDAVRGSLEANDNFVSAQELHRQLESLGKAVGLATVYRTLADLVEAGEADALVGSDGEQRFRACGKTHHHHLICRMCGVTSEIAAAELEEWADGLAKSQGFDQVSHSVELFGRCAECRAKKLA